MKTCIDCNQELPRSKFHIRSNRKIGIESRCKDCSNAKKREYRKNNKEIISFFYITLKKKILR